MDNIVMVKSSREGMIFVVDLNNKKSVLIKSHGGLGVNNGFDFGMCKYTADNFRLEESFGTVAFVCEKDKVYGVLIGSKDKIVLNWVNFNDFKKDKKSEKIHIDSSVVKIESVTKEILTTDWVKCYSKHITRVVCNTNNNPFFAKAMTAEEFIIRMEEDKQLAEKEYANTENKVDIYDFDVYEEDTGDIKEQHEEKNEVYCEKKAYDLDEENCDILEVPSEAFENDVNEPVENKEDTYYERKVIEEFNNNINGRYSELIKLEEKLKIREEEIIINSNKLKVLLAKLEIEDLDRSNVSLLDVEEIYSFCTEEEESSGKSDAVYELLLKTIIENDSISISKGFYSKLNIVILKNLEINTKYTKYKSVVRIKINKGDTKSLLAVIEFDEEKEDVRVTVVRRYSHEKSDDDYIIQCVIEYQKNRRNLT